MGDQWHDRMARAGISGALWRRYRRLVGATLPAPCTVCGDLVQPWHRWHLEHRTPLALGGPAFEPSNLGPAHAACNLRKGGRVARRASIVKPSRDW